jgi:hypothetical protein
LILVVVALQSVLLAFALRAVLSKGDWLSLAIFAYSFLSLFFMPMNLQLAISGPLYIGYVVLVVVFIARAIYHAVSARRRSSDAKDDRLPRKSPVLAGRSLV